MFRTWFHVCLQLVARHISGWWQSMRRWIGSNIQSLNNPMSCMCTHEKCSAANVDMRLVWILERIVAFGVRIILEQLIFCSFATSDLMGIDVVDAPTKTCCTVSILTVHACLVAIMFLNNSPGTYCTACVTAPRNNLSLWYNFLSHVLSWHLQGMTETKLSDGWWRNMAGFSGYGMVQYGIVHRYLCSRPWKSSSWEKCSHTSLSRMMDCVHEAYSGVRLRVLR